MADDTRATQVLAQLSEAVASGVLPAAEQTRAEAMLDTLGRPVRLALMGKPKVGKSTLLNLLVGATVVPEDVSLPTLQLSYGDTVKITCTLSDGSKQELDHGDPASIAALSPVFVDMQRPLPALRKISVLEVVSPADPAALGRACLWAAKRCEIAVWCTQDFDAADQTAWSRMPDVIKDNAFLMVTKADVLRVTGDLDMALGHARQVASNAFNKIMPIATSDAIDARLPDGTVDKDRLRSSGGMALISAVLKQVELGRQNTLDLAEVLLISHQATLKSADAAPAQAPAEPVSEPVAPPIVKELETSSPAEVVKVEDETPDADLTPQPEPELGPESEPELGSDSGPVEDTAAPPLQPATRDAYLYAIGALTDQGEVMTALLDKHGDKAPSKIISGTVEHLQWLSDYLAENGDARDAGLLQVRDMAMDAADLVQLMQMEKSDSAAIEVLSLMIQIKHTLQADLAA